MAKIDTSKIPGYAEMSPEQKITALEAYDEGSADDDSEMAALKKAVSKANSEAAEYKRQLRAKQTDDEAAKAEREAREKELQDKYDELLKQNTIRGYAERYRKMGYDDKLAEATAKAMAEGDFDTVFANGETYRTALEQTIRADVTKKTPKPQNGGSGTTYTTKEEIFKIKDAAERQQAIADNIELFSSKE